MQITGQDEYDHDNREYDPIITQADQAQQREPPMAKANRTEVIDPLRRLGLELLRQAMTDLKDREYKGKSPDPDPMAWMRGKVEATMHVEDACKVAGVSVRRVRERAREIIREANGPLSERDHATPEELESDSHDWIKVSDLGINTNTVSDWAYRGKVTALKVHPGNWRIRVDEKFKRRFEDYRDHRRSRGVGVPPLGELL
jgi:hypothetical protein